MPSLRVEVPMLSSHDCVNCVTITNKVYTVTQNSSFFIQYLYHVTVVIIDTLLFLTVNNKNG